MRRTFWGRLPPFDPHQRVSLCFVILISGPFYKIKLRPGGFAAHLCEEIMRKAAVGKCVLLCLSVFCILLCLRVLCVFLCLSVLCVLLCLSVFCVCSCVLLYLFGCYRGLEMWKIRCRSCSQIKLKVVLLHSALLGWEGQPWLTTFLQLSHCRIPVNTFSDWLLSKRHNLVISLKEESEPHLLTSEFIYTT